MKPRSPIERHVRGILLSSCSPLANASGKKYAAGPPPSRRSLHGGFFCCPRSSLWPSAGLLSPVLGAAHKPAPPTVVTSGRLYSDEAGLGSVLSSPAKGDATKIAQAEEKEEEKRKKKKKQQQARSHPGSDGRESDARQQQQSVQSVRLEAVGGVVTEGEDGYVRIAEAAGDATTSAKVARHFWDNAPAASAAMPTARGVGSADLSLSMSQYARPTTPLPAHSQDSLVNTEGIGPVKDYLQIYRDPYFRRYAQPDGPTVTVSDRPSDTDHPSRDEIPSTCPGVYARLALLVSTRRRMPRRVTLTSIYEAYRELPEPRMLHITGRLRHALLDVMGTPGRKTARGMLRYFALVADVKNTGLTLKRTEWNYALALAGRYAGWTSKRELNSVLSLWREMEVQAGIKGNDVTFNILFDVASKAGNFTLAEMLLREMDSRGIQPDRYYHVGLINFFGLKMDSDGVRAAYKEMLEAGDMIDTLVLNCVMHGFLRCGDEADADRVYHGMLRAPVDRPQLAQHDYTSKRIIDRVFKMFGRISRREPEFRQNLASHVSILPDHRTYRILIDHYVLRAGNIARVVKLLDEMKAHAVAIDGRIYMTLFKGFCKHGRRQLGAESPWSEQRLMSLYGALVHMAESGDQSVQLTKWLALWVLRAFAKCSSKLTVFDVYLELKRVGCLDEAGLDLLDSVATDLMGRVY